MNVLNPAYAGTEESINIGLLGRSQWTGVNGAPKTYTLNVHTPLSEKVGAGLSVIADKIGPVNENNIYADVSYKIDVAEKVKLSFGLKAGVTLLSVDNLTYATADQLQNNDVNKTTPNAGIGAFLYADNYYVGLSTPNLIASDRLKSGQSTGKEEAHYFLTGGYVFTLNDNVKLKPSTLLKYNSNSPVSVDLNANVLLYDKFEIGVGYRLDDALAAMANFQVTKNIRVGYAYDYTISDFSEYSSGSHELLLLFNIPMSKKEFTSPRFF